MKRIIILICFAFLLTSCGKVEKQTELVCENGILEDEKCKIVETMDIVKECREGYKFNEKTKKCENTITIAAKKVSDCPNGYFIGSDNWCLSEKEYEKEVKVNCESKNIKADDKFSSTYVTEDNKCMEKLCVKVSEDGKSCVEFKETELKVKTESKCPDGTKNDDGVCRKKYWMNKDYSCELGEKVGNNCVIKDSIDMDSYCENKEFELNKDGTICEKITYVDPIEKEIG